ncbi:uncharacterized protein DAT39_018548, partial [Clarias magur]
STDFYQQTDGQPDSHFESYSSDRIDLSIIQTVEGKKKKTEMNENVYGNSRISSTALKDSYEDIYVNEGVPETQ